MPSIRLKLDATAVTDWLADISAEFPDTEFNVLTDQSTTDGLLGIVEAKTPNKTRLKHQFEDASEVRSYEIVHDNDDTVVIKCTIPMSEAYRTLRSSGNLPEYPVHLQDGWFSFTVTASHEQLSTYTEELATSDIPYHILSLSQSRDSNELLTDHQSQFITAAVERGYYNMPRECTLEELSESFEINKSSSSRLLRRAENRIIKEFITEIAPAER
ncbi:helix-turn-helix domain-containing protein [Halocatena halophila]|uniref:helix-turn-helix domain-containing protein n=1 Tax=Halocatena halophila TaxID=2814576 RepID=UPI002ED58D46